MSSRSSPNMQMTPSRTRSTSFRINSPSSVRYHLPSHHTCVRLPVTVYDDLSHPPATYLGTQYSYRTADGSYNNISDPKMGKAAEPYARSVQQTHALPRNMLPEAGLVFDTLLKREKVRAPGHLRSSSTVDGYGFSSSSTRADFPASCFHSRRLSSIRKLLFVFRLCRLVLIDLSKSVFRTSHTNVSINETSSYVDLAPLYGNNEETMNKIRVRDGRGLILPDTFAEDRLLMLPPAVCVLLVLFSRNHNVRFGFL